jgi:hypothetical protein
MPATNEGHNKLFGNSWESPSNDSSYKASMRMEGDDDTDVHDCYEHRQGSGETTNEYDPSNDEVARTSSLLEFGDSHSRQHPHDSNIRSSNSNTNTNSNSNCLSPWSFQSALQVIDGLWIVCLLLYTVWTYSVLQQNHHDSSSSSSSSKSTEKLVINYTVLVIVILLLIITVIRSVLMMRWCTTTTTSTTTTTTTTTTQHHLPNSQSRNNRRRNKRTGWWVSRLTMFLCGLYGVLALITWIVVLVEALTVGMGKNVLVLIPLSNDDHSWCSLNSWCHILYNPRAIPWILTGWFVLECFRSVVTVVAHNDETTTTTTTTRDISTRELDRLVNNNNDDDDTNTPSRQHRYRPWWWSRQQISDDDVPNNLRLLDSHLMNDDNGRPGWTSSGNDHHHLGSGGGAGIGDYSIDDGVGTPRNTTITRRWGTAFGSFFSTRQGQNRRYNTNDHINDDGSVDYASLNEDWASRTEEDPYWWTRN